MVSHHPDLLTLHQVYKHYQQAGNIVHVLQGIDSVFERGKSYAITGVSGSGKSTLLHVTGGLDEPSSGSVAFNGKDLAMLPARQKNIFLNRSTGFVFQFHYLVKELSVRENIMMMGLIKGESKKYCLHRVDQLLALVDLSKKADVYPTQLSGGEQQRVSIARALFNKPSF